MKNLLAVVGVTVSLLVAGGNLRGQTTQPADTSATTQPVTPLSDGNDSMRPSADRIAERLRARGIEVTPEQIEQGRKIMDDLRNGVQPDPEQIQKLIGAVRTQVQSRLKETLGATDEEWQVLGPKIEKVQNLMLQAGNAGMSTGRMGMRGFNIGVGTEPTDVQKKLQALQEVLKNKDASKEDLQAAQKDYCDAKAKAKAELDKARAELKELVTIRQEAQLVTMGLLE